MNSGSLTLLFAVCHHVQNEDHFDFEKHTKNKDGLYQRHFRNNPSMPARLDIHIT